jgi:hypothetical protein
LFGSSAFADLYFLILASSFSVWAAVYLKHSRYLYVCIGAQLVGDRAVDSEGPAAVFEERSAGVDVAAGEVAE